MPPKPTNSLTPRRCRKCGANLEQDEISLTRKYFGAAVTEFYCIDCLAQIFGVTVEEMHQKIEDFKAIGCTLFK